MQSIKVAVRRIGAKNPTLDIYTPDEVSLDFEYGYGSQGYDLTDTHYLSEVKDATGAVQGWSVMFVFTKTEDVALAEEKKAKVKNV